MCTCGQLKQEWISIIKRGDILVDRYTEEDGPYWGREHKKYVISQLLAPKLSGRESKCECQIAKTLTRIDELVTQTAILRPDGSMLNRVAIDNAYAVIKALLGDSEKDRRLVALMNEASRASQKIQGFSATGLKATE